MSTTRASTDPEPPFTSVPIDRAAQMTEIIEYSPARSDCASGHDRLLELGLSPFNRGKATAMMRVADLSWVFTLESAVSNGGRYAALRFTRVAGSGGDGNRRSDGRCSRAMMEADFFNLRDRNTSRARRGGK